MSIENFRAQFSANREFVPLNNAGNTLLSTPAKLVLEEWTRRFAEDGAAAIDAAYGMTPVVRSDLANLLGTEFDSLAFFPNTGTAISQVALSFPLKAGDEILVWDQEYPSNFYPWRVAAERAGAKLIVVPSGPNLETSVSAIKELATDKTRVIAFSWIQYRNGAVTDLKELTEFAQKQNIFTCADVIHGIGIQPFHFGRSGLDAVCGGAHKWLCSVHTTGYLCMKPEHVEQFTPIAFGAHTFGTSDDLPGAFEFPKSSAMRFEPGGLPLLNLLALGASVRLILDTGVVRIAQEAEWLARKLAHSLRERGYILNSPHGAHFRGAIVNFSPGPDARFKTVEDAAGALKNSKVLFATRPPGLRLSCHGYNTEADVERALAALT